MTRSVLLLAGGRSRRLGHEKSAVRIGAQTVLERMLDAVHGVDLGPCPDILISVRDEASFRERHAGRGRVFEGVRFVEDARPDLGPVAGLAAGLTAATGDVVAVLGADTPFVTAGLIEGLLSELEGAPDVDVVMPEVEGRVQRLCAAYRAALGRQAHELVEAAGGPQEGPPVTRLLERARVKVIRGTPGQDPSTWAVQCRGIDTPADLQWALERVLARRG